MWKRFGEGLTLPRDGAIGEGTLARVPAAITLSGSSGAVHTERTAGSTHGHILFVSIRIVHLAGPVRAGKHLQ